MQGTDQGALIPRIYRLIFAALSFLSSELCVAPSHLTTECTVIAPPPCSHPSSSRRNPLSQQNACHSFPSILYVQATHHGQLISRIHVLTGFSASCSALNSPQLHLPTTLLSIPVYLTSSFILLTLVSFLSPYKLLTNHFHIAMASPQDPLCVTKTGRQATRLWFLKHFHLLLCTSS